MNDSCDVAVVGAGPAGLATARELSRRGVQHIVLERGEQIGQTWANLYDSLVLHTGKHLSALPGMPFSRATPLFPSRLDFLHYLHQYTETFQSNVRTGKTVIELTRQPDRWWIRTADGDEILAQAVVVATGIVSNPHVPDIAGRERFRGSTAHSADYRRPEPFSGRRVLVVGAGNSAGEIAAELADAGAMVTVAIRSGARTVPRQLLGIPIQYFAVVLHRMPRKMQQAIAELMAHVSEIARGPAMLPPPRDDRCSEIPLIGFHLVERLRAGKIALRGNVVEFTETGARFANGIEEPFSAVILATGFRPALGFLGNQIVVDRCGFAHRYNRVVSANQPALYFVGHNYDTRGALRNIALDARLTAEIIAESEAERQTSDRKKEPRRHRSNRS